MDAAREQMELCALPDSEMLKVLSLLSPEELLAVRPICRRLRDLALHPELWRHFSFDVHWQSSAKSSRERFRRKLNLFAAAVRLAPCAASLAVSTDEGAADGVEGVLLALLAESDCAATRLSLAVDSTQALVVALILQRQAALGRLRELHLQFAGTRKSSQAGIAYLLKVLDNVAGLVILSLGAAVDEAKGLAALPRAAVEPALPMDASLEALVLLNNMSSLEPRLSLYLDRHAATLRQVSVSSDAPGLAEKLAKLPKLDHLACPPLGDMVALIGCPALRSLTLKLKPEVPLAAARVFLRASFGTLTSVELQYREGSLSNDEMVDLVQDLAGPDGVSSRPVLESLVLEYDNMDKADDAMRSPQRPLLPLAAVLPRLAGLRFLDLGGAASDEFLDAVDATVLSELHTLQVRHAEGCAHEWVHSLAVQALLRRCPRLHIEIMFPGDRHGPEQKDGDSEDDSADGKRCEFCKVHPSCHSGIITARGVALYSHSRDEDCAVCRDTDMTKSFSAFNW